MSIVSAPQHPQQGPLLDPDSRGGGDGGSGGGGGGTGGGGGGDAGSSEQGSVRPSDGLP